VRRSTYIGEQDGPGSIRVTWGHAQHVLGGDLCRSIPHSLLISSDIGPPVGRRHLTCDSNVQCWPSVEQLRGTCSQVWGGGKPLQSARVIEKPARSGRSIGDAC
jgi:hypothetical protein